jgi:hypothetical protein
MSNDKKRGCPEDSLFFYIDLVANQMVINQLTPLFQLLQFGFPWLH